MRLLVGPALFLLAVCVHGGDVATEADRALERRQAAEAALVRADAAEAALDLPALRVALEEARDARPDDVETLLRLSRAYADLCLYEADAAERARLADVGLAVSLRALELAPENSQAHLGAARAYGKFAMSAEDDGDRIDFAWKVDEHARRAIALDPANDYAWHALARLQYELAAQGGFRRALAGLFVRRMPPCSFAMAETGFRRAVELRPDRPSHRIELGLTLLRMKRAEEARALLEQALGEPSREPHDEHVKAKARAALARLGPPPRPRND